MKVFKDLVKCFSSKTIKYKFKEIIILDDVHKQPRRSCFLKLHIFAKIVDRKGKNDKIINFLNISYYDNTYYDKKIYRKKNRIEGSRKIL